MAISGNKVGFVATATISGVDATPVMAEVSVGSGLPGIHIVGMPDTAVQEAKQRVRQALKAAKFEMRNRFVVVNLAPASLRKSGSGFDLPIALAYLVATGQINAEHVKNRLCVGELSLDGSVKAVPGQLAYERVAHQNNWGLMTGPAMSGAYSNQCQEHICLEHLAQLRSGDFIPPAQGEQIPSFEHLDFSDIAASDLPKRALQIAAAGSHNLLMIGPPGSGKSMMASRLPTILPHLSEDERVESALIHSVAGLPFDDILEGKRPFRAPHHGASRAGIVGGGNPIQPGEVSFAHNGVLFLDELPEFAPAVLQLLRQPLEQRSVSLARAHGTVTFPANFMLVAASNPCPCGYYNDPKRSCSCTPTQIARYQGRIGGPLMDRIEIIVDVWRSDPGNVLDTGKGTSSAQLHEGVLKAQAFAAWRRAKDGSKTSITPRRNLESSTSLSDVKNQSDLGVNTNGINKGAALLAACKLGAKERSFLEIMAERYQLSGRGIMCTLSVSRTIADMEESEKVNKDHLLEAVSFRKKDLEEVRN